MKYKFILIVLYITFGSQYCSAQHISINKKELAFLASQQKMNVIFTYDNLHFNADNLNETKFINHIKEKIENKLDFEAALDWEERFLFAKDSIFPKIFVASVNNRIKDYDHPVDFVLNDSSLKYTMKVQTNWMYFGYDVGIAKQPAKANLKIYIYETATPERIISEVEVKRAEGLNVIGSLSFNSKGPTSPDWLKEFLEANEDFPRPSLIRMGNMYDKAAVRLGMTLKRVLN